MLAHAFPAVATAIEHDIAPTREGLVPLTVNEFRRLFDALLLTTKRTLNPAGLVAMASDNTNTQPDYPTTDAAKTNDRDLRSRLTA